MSEKRYDKHANRRPDEAKIKVVYETCLREYYEAEEQNLNAKVPKHAIIPDWAPRTNSAASSSSGGTASAGMSQDEKAFLKIVKADAKAAAKAAAAAKKASKKTG
eukprot:1486920-Karenia_brevis.AAC.1